MEWVVDSRIARGLCLGRSTGALTHSIVTSGPGSTVCLSCKCDPGTTFMLALYDGLGRSGLVFS